VPEKSSGVLGLLVSFRLIKEVEDCSAEVIFLFGVLEQKRERRNVGMNE
jgi:hypothetical protein